MGLLTTQTHDAKRSGDVRARIAMLASMPDEWAAHVSRWLEITEPLRSGDAPDDVERYFLFQTLVGAWPIACERIEAYMEKALREAKRNTNWVEPDAEWEASVKRFCRSLYSSREFLADFEPFAARVAGAGDRAALAQVVLKLTAPGVPDIYQGDELPFRALVDPDNRRPVDFGLRRSLLRRVRAGAPVDDETRKLSVIHRLLDLRAGRSRAFLEGGYEPLEADEGVCGFVRGGEVAVVVAVRPGVEVAPPGRWRQVVAEPGISVSER